jgi:hypothetical protein
MTPLSTQLNEAMGVLIPNYATPGAIARFRKLHRINAIVSVALSG